jgi:hypothetical protein
MEIEVLVSVVVRQLLARLDSAKRENVDPATAQPDFAVGSAGVVDETRSIRGNISVDHARITRPEKVLAPVLLDLFGRGGASEVFDYE